jgi:prepilin-type N-terminal cleavage/methylation domain-containing protein/prepilin-type processing-associated H-X9-DG protein
MESRCFVSARRAFTLVELLVVMGVIAILIALLLPALTGARENAKTVKCASQLRSLGQAINNYVVASKGNLPLWSGWHTIDGDGTGPDAPGPAWTEQLASSYAKPGNAIWNCPSFPVERKVNYFLAARYSWLTGQRHSMKVSEVRNASAFVLSGDCTTPSLYPAPWGTTNVDQDDCDKDDATQNALLFRTDPGGTNIHKNGNNVLFLDGHVMAFLRYDASAMTFHAKKMANWEEAALQ